MVNQLIQDPNKLPQKRKAEVIALTLEQEFEKLGFERGIKIICYHLSNKILVKNNDTIKWKYEKF